MTDRRSFITTAELAAQIGAPDLAIVDGSWHLPAANRDARAEYLAGHVPGAIFFDIDAVADRASGLPHMLPKTEDFGEAMGRLGIEATMRIVVYDSLGLFSAPRVWWTFRTFGAENVRILEGGLPQWRVEGRTLEAGAAERPARRFEARLDAARVAATADVQAALADGRPAVVDARAADRFAGDAPEPRPGLRAGHMPGSRNLPFATLVADGRLREPEALRAAFRSAGVDIEEPVITSCGSGVTAAVLVLALAELGKDARLYDGSWSEWGARPDLPVAIGPPR